MKTILSRLGSVKAGTFLSEDLESEYTDITSYANDVEKVLSKVGIRLRDTNKDFRDAQDVLDDVAMGWATYDDLTRQALSTAIAGTKQRESFISLMSNYDKALALENSALNSNGKAMQKYQAYQDSIAAQQDRINALAQTWVQNMNFEWATEQLLSFGEVFLKIFSNETATSITKVTALFIAFGVAVKALSEYRSAKATGDVVKMLIAKPKIVLGVVAAITALVWIIDKLHKSTSELRRELQGLASELETSKTNVESYSQQIEENSNNIAKLQSLIDSGVGGIVEQEDIDKLKEENEQLEYQIRLEERRQELLRGQQEAIVANCFHFLCI